jgi:hypothetical protein
MVGFFDGVPRKKSGEEESQVLRSKVEGLKVGEERGSFGLGMGVSASLTFDFWTFRRREGRVSAEEDWGLDSGGRTCPIIG